MLECYEATLKSLVSLLSGEDAEKNFTFDLTWEPCASLYFTF